LNIVPLEALCSRYTPYSTCV